MVKVIFIGSDRKIFEKGSRVEERMIEYGELFDELHIIIKTSSIFSKGAFPKKTKLSDKVFAYPSNSVSKWFFPMDAVKIAVALIGGDKKSSWIISAQDPFENGLSALKVAEKTGAKLHIQIHVDFLSRFFKAESMLNRVRLMIAKKVLARADGIRVVSKRIRDSLMTRGRFKLKVEPVVLPIYGEFNAAAEPFSFKTSHPEWNFVILMVGRMEQEKNYPLALKVLANVIKKYPKSGLAILGDGRESGRIKRKARMLRLMKNIDCVGSVADPAPYYKGADLFLLTSNYEGYGLAMTEASKAGLPIVGTDVGSVGWLFKHGETALICAPQDAECLTKSIIRLIEENALRERLCIAAHFSVDLELPKDKTEYLNMYKNDIIKCLNRGVSSRQANVEVK